LGRWDLSTCQLVNSPIAHLTTGNKGSEMSKVAKENNNQASEKNFCAPQAGRKQRIRLTVRIIILIITAVLASGLVSHKFSMILPRMSPFLGLCSSIAARMFVPISIVGLIVLIISFVRGRWFCLYVCPLGLLAEYVGKLNRRAVGKFARLPKLGPYILFFALGGAVLGYPVFLWCDPLSIFNDFVSAFRKPLPWPFILSAIGLMAVLILSFWRPCAWCFRCCPLGFMQEIAGKLGRKFKGSGGSAVDRRMFLAGLLGGITAFAARRVFGKRNHLRPPGSVEEDKFTALCARCGNCVGACPSGVLQHDLGETGVTGFMTPVVRIGQAGEESYCRENCNNCSEVCPTGAISLMTLAEKQTVSIGTAVVTKSKCLAWGEGTYCMVCDEYCPYGAIRAVEHDGVNCPEVDPDICRGCGLCQTQCPAEQTAIVVEPRPQRKLKPVSI